MMYDVYMCSGLQQKHTGFYVVGHHLCRSTLISPVVNLTPLGFEWSLKGGESVALFQPFFYINFHPDKLVFHDPNRQASYFSKGFWFNHQTSGESYILTMIIQRLKAKEHRSKSRCFHAFLKIMPG